MIYKCYNYLCAYFFEEKKCRTGMTQSCVLRIQECEKSSNYKFEIFLLQF